MPHQSNKQINGYVELAFPQLLDDKWRELEFDLASGQNVLQDFIMPEMGSGYVYRDARLVGSAVHNRFIYWRTTNDILELVEMSTEVLLEGNQVRIRFANSSIINNVNVIEFSDSIVIMLATVTSVHRLYLPHPKATNKSILCDLTSEVLFNQSNFYILGNQSSLNNQQPICAASWYDKSMLKCALSFPDSSLLIVQFGHNTHHITTCDIKQTGIIGRLWSRMPNLWARNPNDCDNAVFVCIPYHHAETNDVLLFTLCRDCRIRVFSTNSRECVCNHNMIPQSSFSQSFASHTNPTTELPLMKIFGSLVVIYLTENRPEFIFLEHSYQGGLHVLTERVTFQTPSWEKLIDFSVTQQKVWALANMRETESGMCFMDLRQVLDDGHEEGSVVEGLWDFVNLPDETELPSGKSLVAEIFWSNHFSFTTVQKALIGISGPSIPKKNTMEALEEVAFTRIVDDDQDEAWARFYSYCLQNHQTANKSIGLVVAEDESVLCIIKRSNPSFICPWLMNVEMMLQGSPYRGIEFSPSIKGIIEPLNHISNELMTDEHTHLFEQRLFESPANIQASIDDMIHSLYRNRESSLPELGALNKSSISAGIKYVCDHLDLTNQAKEFNEKILKESSNKMKSEHNPLESNSGIILTFELFRRLVRARMILARDLLIYINLLKHSVKGRSDKLAEFCEDLFTSGTVKRIIDSLRSYATLVWLAESPIKTQSPQVNVEVINFISNKFEFFKTARDVAGKSQDTSLDVVISQNLFMNFLAKGGVSFSWLISEISQNNQTISNSFYVTDVALNICKLLWPKAGHMCLSEFMFTQQLDEHLAKYLDLTQEWLDDCEDRHFIRAANCMLQNRAMQAVEILNKLWMSVSYTNLLGRFIGLSDDRPESAADERVPINPTSIYRYYEKLIQLFQVYNNRQCLVTLINNCMALLDENADSNQQQWVNCLRAKLFQYYLELEDSDEAYHTMVLTTDPSLRINCLRKFIVSHCEKEQWSNLLSYPFIDIKNDFIDILNQKADSLDLSNLNAGEFYKTTYYDLLFASYVSDEEYKRAAHVMYNYAQRLAQEVPGITSIRKQADCLLIALNSLRCVEEKERFIECGSNNQKEDGRSTVLKRSYDSESDATMKARKDRGDVHFKQAKNLIVGCKEIERKYELTRARLRLLEKDQTANAIALSPLKPEETIAQLVASSMFSAAIDLALLFKTSMDIILEGLTAKYILVMRLSTVDIAVHQDIERGLSDLFTNSYSNIDTYNYVANSTSPLVERLWRLIDYYLITYDGVSHRYRVSEFANTFTGATVIMRVVASKLLSAGYDVPASLRRLYVQRNTAELLKLLMKYDKLIDAAELAMEMVGRLLEPANCFSFTSPFSKSEPSPIYLPTHLILLLISYLNEDATNMQHIKAANALADKLSKFRNYLRSS